VVLRIKSMASYFYTNTLLLRYSLSHSSSWIFTSVISGNKSVLYLFCSSLILIKLIPRTLLIWLLSFSHYIYYFIYK
jgi:hypothetical protein